MKTSGTTPERGESSVGMILGARTWMTIEPISESMVSAALIDGIVLGLLADGNALFSTGSIGLIVAQMIAVVTVGLGSELSEMLRWVVGAATATVIARRRSEKQ